MKKTALLLLTLACTVSCKSKDNPTPLPDVDFTVSPDRIEIEATGGEASFTVTAAQKPYIVGSFDWCKNSQSAFAENKVTVSLSISENKSTEAREAQFSVVCGEQKKYVTVSQKGVNPLAFLEHPSLPDNNAVALTHKLGFGWNLGNQMDAVTNGVSSETAWGNKPCTQETFNSLKDKGFSTVRVPVTWMGHIGEAPDYKIEEAWMNRVAEILGYAKTAGLNAIVNLHHDDSPEDGWILVKKAATDNNYRAEMLAKYQAVWKQIAERFADEGDWLIFEAYNEIQDGKWGYGDNLTDGGKQYGVIDELAQAFVNTVRATGGKNADRYLAVLGYSAGIYFAIDNLTLPVDKTEGRLIVSVHCYDPSGYALGQNSAYTEWGHTGTVGKKDPNHSEKNIVEVFGKLKERFLDKGIPVYIGECGVVNRGEERADAFQRYWFEFVYKAAREYGLSITVWDNGVEGRPGEESFGFLNHADGSCINGSQTIIDIMNKAYNTEDQAYTLQTVYENAPE